MRHFTDGLGLTFAVDLVLVGDGVTSFDEVVVDVGYNDAGLVLTSGPGSVVARWRARSGRGLRALPDPPWIARMSSISLHHWSDPLGGLREVVRALRPGGRLCLADITLPRWIAALIRSHAQTPAAIRRLVEEAGLELREQRRILARVIVLAVAVRHRALPPRVDDRAMADRRAQGVAPPELPRRLAARAEARVVAGRAVEGPRGVHPRAGDRLA